MIVLNNRRWKMPDMETVTIPLSPQKLEALKNLSASGLKLSNDYDILLEYASPQTTLEDVRKRLSAIKTSLADELVEERNR
jgi:hypothetical protein